MRTRWFIVAVLSASTVAMLACQKDEGLPQHQASATPGAASTSAPVAAADTPDVSSAPAPALAPQPAVPAQAPAAAVLASTEGELSDVRIDITQFKRDSGGTVTLRFLLANNSASSVAMYGSWLGDSKISSDHRGVGGIHLLDAANKKKYFVVRDADSTCVCSRAVDDVKAGGKVNLWAKFPAPPPDVQRLTLVIPHFQPVDDVPLS